VVEKKGRERKSPFVGIKMLTLTPTLAKENNQNPDASIILPEISGVLVTHVFPDTPAEASGLLIGDLITQLNDLTLQNNEQFRQYVAERNIGEVLQVKVIRDNTVKYFDIEVGDFHQMDINIEPDHSR
ncbi:PDZ domain-containing protein, partial [Crocosphaera chwakensis]